MYPNPRFPHTCRIYRTNVDADAFSEGDVIEVYNGKCRVYLTTRSVGDTKVTSSQYTLAIPAYTVVKGKEVRLVIDCFPGDKVECIDARGKQIKGTAVNCYMGTLGTNVYWNYNAE
jgi:hypothetical protein